MSINISSLNSFPIAIMIIKRDYIITEANDACHLLFGYNKNELINKNMDCLISESKRENHHQLAEEYWKSPYQKPLGHARDVIGLRKDKSEIPVEVGLYPYQNNIMAIIIDISVRNVKEIVDTVANLKSTLQKIEQQISDI